MFDRIKNLINPPLDPARVGLLRGRARHPSVQGVLRPPWAIVEATFLQACERCEDCVCACPEHLIKRGEGGFPEVDFSVAHCSFCSDCVAACGAQALCKTDAQGTERRPWSLWPQISADCLLQKQVTCRTCGDMCTADVIHFDLVPGRGGIPQMRLDVEACNGCGACVAPCPTQAIRLLHTTGAA
jgi:ferredoxin-type protein NapF